MTTTSHVVRVVQCGEHLHVDLRELPPHLRGVLSVAIDPLLKAAEAEDPRFPELETLAGQIARIWSKWTARAVDALTALLGRRAPPQALDTELNRFAVGVLADTTGYTADRTTAAELVQAGDLPESYPLTAPIPTAVRLGFAADPHQPARPRDPVPAPAPRDYSSAELGALAYARERAGVYMRRPVEAVSSEARMAALHAGDLTDRRLTPHQRALVSGAIQDSIRDGDSTARAAQRLRDAVAGTRLSNDMTRVARTELAYAHHHGALVALRAAVGDTDPQVYKTVSPQACRECRRIWGDPRNPNLYRLSVVMAGDNFGRPAPTWGPTIGPTHPNCTCPPIQVWDAAVHDAVQDVAAELAATFGAR